MAYVRWTVGKVTVLKRGGVVSRGFPLVSSLLTVAFGIRTAKVHVEVLRAKLSIVVRFQSAKNSELPNMPVVKRKNNPALEGR